MKRLGDVLLNRRPFTEIVMGNTALVRVMIESRTRVTASYPGSPPPEIADAIRAIPLERNEAMRGMNGFLKKRGALIYCNTVWQPLDVRLGKADEVSEEMIRRQCEAKGIREVKVFKADLEDARMQNIVVLANITKHNLVPGVRKEHYLQAMENLMEGRMLEENTRLFEEVIMNSC